MRQIREPGLCPEYNAGGGQEELSRLWMKPGEWIGRAIIKHERGVSTVEARGVGLGRVSYWFWWGWGRGRMGEIFRRWSEPLRFPD